MSSSTPQVNELIELSKAQQRNVQGNTNAAIDNTVTDGNYQLSHVNDLTSRRIDWSGDVNLFSNSLNNNSKLNYMNVNNSVPNSNMTISGPTNYSNVERLIPVSVLPKCHQTVFAPHSFFNKLQTKCFHAAYQTDENLLISSPTASGKTQILELAICQFYGDLTSNKSPSLKTEAKNKRVVYISVSFLC